MGFDPNYQFVHSTTMDFGNEGYFMIINEKNVDTGESRLRTIQNPIRPFWVTKQGFRNHTEKKEFAKESELEMYRVPQNALKIELAKALGEYKGPNAWYDIRKLCNNPYVYGADIDPEVIIRIGYMKNCRPISSYKVGFLDIETSVFGDGRVIVLSFADHKFCIHTAILKAFMQDKTGEDILKHKKEVWMSKFLDPLNHDAKKALMKNHRSGIDTLLQNFTTIQSYSKIKEEYEKWLKDKNGDPKDYSPEFNKFIYASLDSFFTFDMHIFEDERDLLIWSFKNIHEAKCDFIGIWNMDYDIPYLIDRFQKLGVPPQDAFSHPDVPKRLHFCKYKQDPGKPGQHFTDKWHWLYAPGYTKYIDSMNLYSRIRKVDGRENTYKLDFIAEKEIGVGKMPLQATHEVMQEKFFTDYVVYNQVDVGVLVIMELVNHDMDSLIGLSHVSPLYQFAHQTKMLTNNFYEYCRDKHLVPAAIGGSQIKASDALLYNVGGAVLDPTNIRDAGLPVLEESEDITNLYTMTCDIDVSLTTWGATLETMW